MGKSGEDQTFIIDPETVIGHVHIRVSDVQRAVGFYEDLLGFKIMENSDEETVHLSADGSPPPLLVISRARQVEEARTRRAGLYHFAILLPKRKDLGTIVKRLLDHRSQVYFEGAADHSVSEAIYLRDPDFIGIEIYRDRNAAQWRRSGRHIEMVTEPLDTESLLLETERDRWRGMPSQTRIGHGHLHVSSLEKAKGFYSKKLGFYLTCSYPGAYFFAADEYHHHVAANIWLGEGVPPAMEAYPGLDHYAIKLPGTDELKRLTGRLSDLGIPILESGEKGFPHSVFVRDPSNIKIQLYAERSRPHGR